MKSITLRAVRPSVPAAWTARLRKATEQASQHWQRLSARERLLLRGLAAFLAAAALYAIALRPAWNRIEHWQTALPQLRAQAASVDALVQEAQTLKREQGRRIAARDMEEALRASLARAALGGTQQVEKTDGDKGWRVTFADAAPAALFDWLAQAPALLHLRIAQVRVARPRDALGRPIPARASGTLTLREADDAANGSRP